MTFAICGRNPRFGYWNAEKKDQLEDVMHRGVCDGLISLRAAQDAFRGNWTVAYRREVGENKMGFEVVEKKQREARFFLGKMAEWERRAFGEKEPFDFYLSAFLSAARTIDYRLHKERPEFKDWRAEWDSALPPAERDLVRFMSDDRNLEVHERGSGRQVGTEEIVVHGSYSDASGTVEISAPPGAGQGRIIKPAYTFAINGAQRKVTDVAREYLDAMDRMVADFKAAAG